MVTDLKQSLHLFTSISLSPFSRSFSFLNGIPPNNIRGAVGGMFCDPHLDRLLEDPLPLDASGLSVICQPMQVKH